MTTKLYVFHPWIDDTASTRLKPFGQWWNGDAAPTTTTPPPTLKSVADSGLGQDTFLIGNTFTLLDTGGLQQEDAKSVASVPVPDVGTGDDQIPFLKVVTTVTDNGVGTETLTIVASLVVADAALGDDLAVQLQLISILDAGVAADSLDVPKVTTEVVDTGVGVESITVVKVVVSVADVATGQEVIGATAELTVTDAGVATEVVTSGDTSIQIATARMALKMHTAAQELQTRTARFTLVGGTDE